MKSMLCGQYGFFCAGLLVTAGILLILLLTFVSFFFNPIQLNESNRHRAFTLVKVMWSSTIFVILIVAIYFALHMGMTVYKRGLSRIDVQQQVRNGMTRIVIEVRESQSSTVTPINLGHDQIRFNTLNEVGIFYYLQGTDLVREYPPGVIQKVASDISRLNFIKKGKVLNVLVESTHPDYPGIFFDLQEEVRLRNE